MCVCVCVCVCASICVYVIAGIYSKKPGKDESDAKKIKGC